MATYKVIQDIEAEDKLVGPLTLRQFIYAGIVLVLGFIAYQLAQASPFIASPLLIPMLFFAALAAPLSQDQPSEVWMLAKVRFFLKPRRRIWNQDGISDLVTVTAPKKIERILTDGLSQNEVESRLSALANTLDSRGWAVKNVSVNMYGQAGYLNDVQDNSDRLVSAASLPQDVPIADVTALDDMMDEAANPTAQNLERMIAQSEQTHRQQIVDKMAGKAPAVDEAQAQADYWFMNQQQAETPAGLAMFNNNPLVAPGKKQPVVNSGPTTQEEQTLLNKIHTGQGHTPASFGHLKTIQPLSADGGSQQSSATSQRSKENSDRLATGDQGQVTTAKTVRPDIMRLANNDDLNISTIARQANRELEDGGEVVVSLH